MLNSNLAINVNSQTGCTYFDIAQRPTKPINRSNYTSQGKRKASPCDPIREQSDILLIKDYLLNNGRTTQLRLRNYALFTLGISIGIRGIDLLNLRISDVLNPDGTITDEMRAFESKTRKSIYPFINEAAKQALSSYLDSLSSFSYNDYLFSKTSTSQEPMTPNNLYKLMIKIKKDLNLPYHLGAHSLRKTFAYWTIKLHPNDLTTMISLQEMLNHDSMNTTLHYAGQTKDKIKPMYTDLEKIFNTEAVTVDKPDKVEKLYSLFSNIMEIVDND